ncbi:MAG: hypothetical protein EOP04_28590 [Proteobacteria bacterium]|nr:MAG: hypothetical protein EOP04_28590 [Pseudomonadota bacterium]
MGASFFRESQNQSHLLPPRSINPWHPIKTPDGRIFRIYEPRVEAVDAFLVVSLTAVNAETQDVRDFEVWISPERSAPIPCETFLFVIGRRMVGEWLYSHRSNMDRSVFQYAVRLDFPEIVPEAQI